MELQGQVAVITGGSRGIGRATALAFAHEGADIAFCHLFDDDQAERTAAEIAGLGRRVRQRALDVRDIRAGRAFARWAADELGPIDILFNSAGSNIRKPFEEVTEDNFDGIVGVHLKGMYFMAQAVYPAMVARGRGCIINIASQLGFKGGANNTAYSAAKAGIIGFTRALAHDLAADGITVNCVVPGLIGTPRPKDRPEPAHHLTHQTITGARGRPEDVATAVRFLCGPGARYINGQAIHANGGAYLGG
jgi:3-oxoacyl-[acyl-carrier protein] reductase